MNSLDIRKTQHIKRITLTYSHDGFSEQPGQTIKIRSSNLSSQVSLSIIRAVITPTSNSSHVCVPFIGLRRKYGDFLWVCLLRTTSIIGGSHTYKHFMTSSGSSPPSVLSSKYFPSSLLGLGWYDFVARATARIQFIPPDGDTSLS